MCEIRWRWQLEQIYNSAMGSFRSLLIYTFVIGKLAIAAEAGQRCNQPKLTPRMRFAEKVEVLNTSLSRSDSTPVVSYTISAPIAGKNLPLKVKKYSAAISPCKGTVLLLCAGPEACMDKHPQNIPASYDIVTFDYIGLGQNTLGPAPSEFLSIEAQAQATVAVVQGLKLKNYVIQGESFGTTVATIASSYINEINNLPQPKATVLQGTAAAQKVRNGEGYFKTAQRTWALLDSSSKRKFRDAYLSAWENASPDQRSLIDGTINSYLLNGPEIAASELKQFSELDPEIRNKVAASLQPKNVSGYDDSTSYDRMYAVAGCQVVPPQFKGQRKLFDNLVPYAFQLGEGEVDPCSCPKSARAYDPNEHQILNPILYLSGSMDPATPPQEARYHYDGQTHAKDKALVILKDGGHFPTSYELSTCRDQVYQGVFSGDLKLFKPPGSLANGCLNAPNTKAVENSAR